MSKRKKGEADESRTPVLRGKTYCSPACGGGCTKKEYDRAVRDAGQLVERLVGWGWEPRVWENLGWHFAAVSGPVQVYGDRLTKDKRLRYTCLISDRVDGSGGSMLWTDRVPRHTYDDPNQAVEDMFETALLATTGVVETLYAAYVAQGGPTVGLLPLAKTLLFKLVTQVTREEKR